MGEVGIRLPNDDRVDKLIGSIADIVRKHGIRHDERGQWFSANQLDAVRCILETRGWKTARLYQVGKIDQRDRPFDLKKNEALVEIIDAAAMSGLDRATISYTIGKVNSVLADKLGVDTRGGQRSGQRR